MKLLQPLLSSVDDLQSVGVSIVPEVHLKKLAPGSVVDEKNSWAGSHTWHRIALKWPVVLSGGHAPMVLVLCISIIIVFRVM